MIKNSSIDNITCTAHDFILCQENINLYINNTHRDRSPPVLYFIFLFLCVILSQFTKTKPRGFPFKCTYIYQSWSISFVRMYSCYVCMLCRLPFYYDYIYKEESLNSLDKCCGRCCSINGPKLSLVFVWISFINSQLLQLSFVINVFNEIYYKLYWWLLLWLLCLW